MRNKGAPSKHPGEECK